MRVLAEIPARTSPGLRSGSLRRDDLEAYGELLEKLGDARCVAMTGDGSSGRSAAAGMAATAAARGARTALVECDLGEPTLADELGLANAPGLHEYLRGTAEVAAILKPVILAGPGSEAATEPLVCVVGGRPASDSSALLASERFRHAIDGLRAAYESVVIVAPQLRDEQALHALLEVVDETLLCVGPNETRRKPQVPVGGLVVLN